jgi:hypothetical protein
MKSDYEKERARMLKLRRGKRATKAKSGIPWVMTMGFPEGTVLSGDLWAHRSSGMRCSTCMYFCPKSSLDGVVRLGRCRRHAPTMNGYPVVFPHDWCGDHKLDENSQK